MKSRTPLIAGSLASAILAASLSGCALIESNNSSAQSEQTLQRLQAARETDLSNARDPEVGPVASGDYSLRADDAEQVAYELEHGQYVSQSRIDAASFVPPKSLSRDEKVRLIHQLEDAKNQDDRGWWDWTRDPIIAQDFAVQEKKASRAIKDLETGEQVSWLEIQQGLEVPQYP